MKGSLKEMQGKMSMLRASLFPNGEGEVWLYGSRARGDFKEESDWDIIIISSDLADNMVNFKRYGMPFVELGIDYDQTVIPLLYSSEQWDKEKDTLFHYNVMNEKICI